MPVPQPHPEIPAYIEAASRIVAAAIKSGKVPAEDASEVGKYFNDVFQSISGLRRNVAP